MQQPAHVGLGLLFEHSVESSEAGLGSDGEAPEARHSRGFRIDGCCLDSGRWMLRRRRSLWYAVLTSPALVASLEIQRYPPSNSRVCAGLKLQSSLDTICVVHSCLLQVFRLSRLVYVGLKSGKRYHRETVRQSASWGKCAGQDVSVRDHL